MCRWPFLQIVTFISNLKPFQLINSSLHSERWHPDLLGKYQRNRVFGENDGQFIIYLLILIANRHFKIIEQMLNCLPHLWNPLEDSEVGTDYLKLKKCVSNRVMRTVDLRLFPAKSRKIWDGWFRIVGRTKCVLHSVSSPCPLWPDL